MMRGRHLKTRLLRVHLWLGIILGFFWSLQGLSGAMLVFNRDIQAAWLAPAGAAAPLPLDTVIVRANKATGAKVTRLETFGPDPLLLLAYYPVENSDQIAVIDGRSGVVVDRRDPAAMLPSGGASWGWLLRLHETLLVGEAGMLLVGTSGLFLLTTILIGFWNVGWIGKWRDAFRMTRLTSARQRLVGWHRLLGTLAAPALLVMVTCGIYLAFAPQLRSMLTATAGYQMPYKPKAQVAAPDVMLTAEQAYDVARQHFPGATLVRLVLPTAKSPVYLFRLLQRDDARRWAGTSTIAIDPRSGAVRDVYDSARGPLANRVTDAIYSIHTGDVAGVAGRLLVMLAGLSLPVFAVTGVISWIRMRRRRSFASARAR